MSNAMSMQMLAALLHNTEQNSTVNILCISALLWIYGTAQYGTVH